jgi:predicted Rdx family selenoprotein
VIKDAIGVDAELIASGGGVFEVVANRKLIFSKKALRRFPEDDEILSALRKMNKMK